MKHFLMMTIVTILYFGNTMYASEEALTKMVPIVVDDLIVIVPVVMPVVIPLAFVIDSQKGTATNTQTNEIWQNGGLSHSSREDAIEHCNTLNYADITHWRLPTSAEAQYFHAKMNIQGNVPTQLFSGCLADITSDGYVKTKVGAEQFDGNPGDSINFSGSANVRCISDNK